jgi:recombinational DNA repair ATPase RecF
MKNANMEKLAKAHVIRFEELQGRRYLPGQTTRGKGYDLVTQEPSGKRRFIEIKSTRASRHSYRWLEQKQYDALKKRRNFWIYLVLEVTKNRAKVRPVASSKWPKRPTRVEKKRWYKIPEQLQHNAEEVRA